MKRDAAATLRAAVPHRAALDRPLRVSAHVLCGLARNRLGDLAGALEELQAALRLDPNHAPAWAGCAEVFASAGRLEDAESVWLRVSRLRARDPEPWVQLAEIYQKQERHEAACSAARQAWQRAPGRVDLALDAVMYLRAAKLEQRAYAAIHEALQHFPKAGVLLMVGAECATGLGRAEEGLALLDRLLGQQPNNLDARSRRATHLMQTRQLDAAERDIQVMMALEPDCPRTLLQCIRLATLRGDRQGAASLLETLLHDESRLSELELAHALLYRAELRGKEGDPEGEWDDTVRGQEVLGRAHGASASGGERYLQTVRRQAVRMQDGSRFRRAAASLPRCPPPGSALEGAPPVFLFGFPRSGTTLLERVLAAHPDFSATDEYNLLGRLVQVLRTDCADTPVEDLSDAQVRYLRDRYLQLAREQGFGAGGTRIIDKLPLNFVYTDVVRRLFPDSPVLMLLRDPRSCVWSAFRQPFDPSPIFGLTHTLAGTARLYTETLRLWQDARCIDGLRLCEVHYEHLVTDFEPTARRVVAATGADWDPAVLEYHSSLGRAFVRTPSFAAVGRRVYRERLSSWSRHAERMAPVMADLQPYIDRYGIDVVLDARE